MAASTKKMTALLLIAIMLLGLAAPAMAASRTWVAVNTSTTIYISPDENTNNKNVTLSEGEGICITDEASNGVHYIITYQDETSNVWKTGFVRKSAVPNFKTTPLYAASINADNTPLYKYYTATTGNFTNLNNGTTVYVLSSAGGYYFVKYDIFYGYIAQSKCTATNAVATAAPTDTSRTVAALTGNPVAYGVVASGASLYESPSTSSRVLGTFAASGTVGIISQTGTATDSNIGFYYISSGGNYTGYVPTAAVSVSDNYLGKIPTDSSKVGTGAAATAAATTTSTGTAGKIANCSSWVSMRASAKSSSKRLYKLPVNTSVTILGTSGSYTKVTYKDKTGYVLSTYIKK